MVATEKVVPYFDISFQHASGTLLRRMRRFGDGEKFLHLLTQVRALNPEAGVRSNFIVGFPGESESEFQELIDFISAADLDAIGIFPYSDEEKTEAATLEGKLEPELINKRTEKARTLAEELVIQRAESRVGQRLRVLIEDSELGEGRAEHQGPEVDSTTTIYATDSKIYRIGEYVDAVVIDNAGPDLVAQPL
jgi:tRNA A37 methylthiotransferase MiaB